jgi:hypothetical protein
MEDTERRAFEEDIINRALQHDLLLHGSVAEDEQLVFDWRSDEKRFGPLFERRGLAIDWLVEWLADDTRSTGRRR